MSQTAILGSAPTVRGDWIGRLFLTRLLRQLALGQVTVRLPSGEELVGAGAGSGPEATLFLHRWRALRQLVLGGDVGFAEAFMDGDWSSPDLPALIELAARNQDALGDSITGTTAMRLLNRVMHRWHANTKRGSRRNIVSHYDLGNDFYESWLDRGMSYSSALFTDPHQSLEEAQEIKQDRVLRHLGVTGAETVLEIGCGWGGLAERICARGCDVTGITLSPAQLDYAQRRFSTPGPKAEIRLQDYRDVNTVYDRIVSIEMLEAVGVKYWPTYFAKLRACLAPGGVAVLQVITIADEKFSAYLRSPDFIQRYIFPGGMLPTPSIMQRQIGGAGLSLDTVETFGLSYARTLAEWRRRFHDAWPRLRASGLDEIFGRKWDYYLAYCEAGFRAGAIDVALYRVTNPA
ncbi:MULTISPECIES: cyclopropane-fatty-acyl-phospholipid synthase family protein [unclassified Acidisoma]|jgi:cyclopropane-fatty-acyl-phospholipid synthase|uniref:SAM-dependent methyltransferase n=1 Tax=unclassified Acidisoma TaxID=2634065 RepID=UPI00131BB585|nr:MULTISPECIES: cyclopropane-fatty-acyl-phospholipid synthase family protein [unclassified Acidisoma]